MYRYDHLQFEVVQLTQR